MHHRSTEWHVSQKRIVAARKAIEALCGAYNVSPKKLGRLINEGYVVFHRALDIQKEVTGTVQSAVGIIRSIRQDRRRILGKAGLLTRVEIKHGSAIERRLSAWRPGCYRAFKLAATPHSRDIRFEQGKLYYTFGLAQARSSSGVPWVVTDRFVLKHDPILEDDVAYRALYIDDKEYKLVDGYIARWQGFFGAAARDFDAKKAAKMKAVRHVKVRIGVV